MNTCRSRVFFFSFFFWFRWEGLEPSTDYSPYLFFFLLCSLLILFSFLKVTPRPLLTGSRRSSVEKSLTQLTLVRSTSATWRDTAPSLLVPQPGTPEPTKVDLEPPGTRSLMRSETWILVARRLPSLDAETLLPMVTTSVTPLRRSTLP